jgi:hypothetical protein
MTINTPRSLISIGFLSCIGLLIATLVINSDLLGKATARLEQAVMATNQAQSLALEMRLSSRERALLLHAMSITSDPFERDEQFMELRQLGTRFLSAREKLLELDLSERERALLEHQDQLSSVAGPLQYRVIDLLNEGRELEANELLLREAIPAQERALRFVDSFVSLQQETNRQAIAGALETFRQTEYLITYLGGGSVIIATLIALLISHRLRRIDRHLVGEAQERRILMPRIQAGPDLIRAVAREVVEQQFDPLETHDQVTGLPGLVLLAENLHLATSQATLHERKIALLRIRLLTADGEPQQDSNYLRRTAGQLRELVRDVDSVFFLGRGGFGILVCDQVNGERLHELAWQIHRLLSHTTESITLLPMPTIQIAYAIHPDDGDDDSSLWRSLEQQFAHWSTVESGVVRAGPDPSTQQGPDATTGAPPPSGRDN